MCILKYIWGRWTCILTPTGCRAQKTLIAHASTPLVTPVTCSSHPITVIIIIVVVIIVILLHHLSSIIRHPSPISIIVVIIVIINIIIIIDVVVVVTYLNFRA